MADSLRKTLDESAMSRFQWIAVSICVILNMLDGFDVLVMAFTAPTVSAEWGLNGAQLGVLFSAGLVGMAAGSLFLAPQADRFGRQAIILFSLVLVTIGMLLSGFVDTSFQLAAMRAITGVGIGGMLAGGTVITAEYSSARLRSTAVGIQALGYPVGATVGGSIAAMLLEHYGWRSVFIFGAAITAAMIPLVLWRLPESVDFLLTKRPPNALKKINALLRKMGHPELDQLPPAPAIPTEKRPNAIAGLFANGLARQTVLIWAAYFLLMFSFYFAMSWTPKLLVAAGLSAQQGITGGVLLNVGGMFGGVLFGVLAPRMSLARLTGINMAVASVCMVAFGAVTGSLGAAFAVACGIGLFLFAAMGGLYAFAPAIYPAGVRTTGMGWAIGVGRLGAILAPLIAGVLLDGGWVPANLYYAFALPLLAAMVAVLALGRSGKVHAVEGVVAAH